MSKKLEKYEKKLREELALNVGELKEILSHLPDDMLIGRSGHFGEFEYADKKCFTLKTAYITSDGYWRTRDKKNIDILELDMPEIGPGPE